MKQLAKLILMLSSEQDGEVVAAARAIGRWLATNKKDWHWLSQQIEKGKAVTKVSKDEIEINVPEACDYILENAGNSIRARDFEFVRDLKSQRYRPTDKQMSYLLDLYGKVKWRREGVRV